MSIRLLDICKHYVVGKTKINALNGVSYEFRQGTYYSILGRSGSGKSSLLHIIGSIDEPTSGEVYFNNVNFARLSDKQKAKFRCEYIGFIFQAFHLEQNYSCLENVVLPLIAYQYNRSKRKLKAIEALERVGLKDRIFHKPIELSGGEQQRVAIARAIVCDPPVILADEPTGNLDSSTGKTILSLLYDFSREGKTVILVTHDESEATKVDFTIRLEDGLIQADG